MSSERNDFIRDIIDDDLRTGRHTRVATRFPPEPNGYLHIGHAKAICVDFGIARDYGGTCNLRYDDTNPTKEDVEYVESIEQDVRWLGFAPSAVLFSADYFPRMYELAERLVREGLAYVCDLDDEQIREYRGSLTEPGKPSPFRERSIDENLDLLRRMKAGEFPNNARTLRAKIDMASANMKMRDPLLYRIRHAHHHRTGDAWCIYPMYDYAHPLEDAIEGITHSICTLEFENNRELYDWVLDHTGPWDPRPHQYEMARLALEYTVMSKRKLLQLVEGNYVSGWDDPRMPTIAGMRRRGYSPEAIRAFADMIGVAKANSMVDIGKLEYCVRDELNQNAPRVLGVLRPIEVELVGLPAGGVVTDAPYFPADVGKPGSRPLMIGPHILIDRDDWRDDPPSGYQRLAPGRTIRLRYGPCITAEEVTRRAPDGTVQAIRATVLPETLAGKNPDDGRKVAGVIHWVDAATSLPVEVRLYDRLFKTARPEEGGGDFLEHLDRASLEVVHGARVEASLATAQIGSRWQLERLGYFIVDSEVMPGALVLNRIITLRDTHSAAAAVTAKPASDAAKKPNAKAASRPKSKSPAEYRAEARARDPMLAAAHARIAALGGVTADWADLLTGDRDTAALYETTVGKVGHADLTAKWMINELPRALAGKELADAGLDAIRFAELVKAVAEQRLAAPAAKAALAEMIATGKALGDLAVADVGGGAVDLDSKIQAVIAANPDKAAQYKAGKTGLLGFFVGQVMKTVPGANPSEVNEAVRSRLG
ncbi:MAG: glutamine--tRNA ligase/YqeY domain fusion protein [Deltaproteobacteria bacterium]|nr:glutamine--tRNA ligase/YqeY domain fusion protein [Deltaproteobacteria bacterium]MDQ3295510.1 glutamine--tRNA ligase/YqeY domain fusion protein [Myxococcota bacterium]